MLGHDDGAGRAVAGGLWIALIASTALIVIGVFGVIAGLKPAVWVAVAGVIFAGGTALAIRSRRR
ncbi:hypothetical protein [Streptomyces griseus]|uniref:hypothetical protein n=1 Tax=Streptomyces griseus TaxID=1911 RepID=UPI000568F6EC|nr:hypothetical protein [Streptomyces griseus]